MFIGRISILIYRQTSGVRWHTCYVQAYGERKVGSLFRVHRYLSVPVDKYFFLHDHRVNLPVRCYFIGRNSDAVEGRYKEIQYKELRTSFHQSLKIWQVVVHGFISCHTRAYRLNLLVDRFFWIDQSNIKNITFDFIGQLNLMLAWLVCLLNISVHWLYTFDHFRVPYKCVCFSVCYLFVCFFFFILLWS